MCATGGAHNTTCCTHTFSRCLVSSSFGTLCVQNACVHIGSRMSTVTNVSCAKYSHPYMCHPPCLLFPVGHLDVHLPASPADSPAMPLPRSVSTPPSQECASPPGRSWSLSVANLNTRTGYEPNCDVDNDTEITPTIFPDTDDNEPHLSIDLVSEGDQTKFGSRQAAASAASTVFNPSRVCVDPCTGRPVQRERARARERERKRGRQCSASERTRFRNNSSVVSVERSILWRKRDESTESATLRDRQNLHEFLERQAQLAEIKECEVQNLRCMSRTSITISK